MALTRKAAAVLAAALAAGPAWAGSGGRPGGLFEFGANARALALGGAYAALAEDASSLYYNPAGLGLVPARTLALMHATLFEAASYDYLAYGQPLGVGGFGAQLVRLGVGGVDGRDDFNQPNGGIEYAETALAAGFGYKGLAGSPLAAGAGVKVLRRSLAGVTSDLFGLDLGLRRDGSLFGRPARSGLVLQNALALARGDTDDRLPLRMRFGAAVDVLEGLRLAGEVDSEGEFGVGTEYEWGPARLRLGWQAQGLSLGGGMKVWESFELDFAVLRHADLGFSNRVSLAVRLGGERADHLRRRADKLWEEAEGRLRDCDYVRALERMAKASTASPESVSPERAVRRDRLESLLKEHGSGLDAPGCPDEPSRLVKEAVLAYLDGGELRALTLAQAAVGEDEGRPRFRQLLSSFEARTGRKTDASELLPLDDLLALKRRQVLEAFYAAQFDLAYTRAEELVEIDPRSAVSWTRLGSCAFAAGHHERAKEAFRKAISIEPLNLEVLEFMRKKAWR